MTSHTGCLIVIAAALALGGALGYWLRCAQEDRARSGPPGPLGRRLIAELEAALAREQLTWSGGPRFDVSPVADGRAQVRRYQSGEVEFVLVAGHELREHVRKQWLYGAWVAYPPPERVIDSGVMVAFAGDGSGVLVQGRRTKGDPS